MDFEKILNNMNITQSQREFILNKHKDDIINKTESIWKVVEDAGSYGFNSSHSYSVALDSLYTAWAKAHYPFEFYQTVLRKYSADKKTEKVAMLKKEAFAYKGIVIVPLQYGQDNRNFTINKDKGEISQSLMAVKGINENVANIVYNIYKNNQDVQDFYTLYILMKFHSMSKTHISNLVKIGYFENIDSNRNRCLWLCDNYDDINKKVLKKEKIPDILNSLNINMSLVEFYDILKAQCIKDTPKQLSFEEGVLAKILYAHVNIDEVDALEKLAWECDMLKTTVDQIDSNFLLGKVVKYNPKKNSVLFKHIETGEESWMKNNSGIELKEKDYIFINTISSRTWRGRELFAIETMTNLTTKYLSKKS